MSDELPGQVNLPCMKAKAAAEYLDIRPKLLWDLKMENLIPHFQLRPRSEIYYPVVGLEEWLKSNHRPRPKGGGR